MPFLAVIAANLASSIARFCKLSPLGANVKLGESGFAIYKSVIQRETSEIWASVLASWQGGAAGPGDRPAQRRSPVYTAVPTERRCHGPKDYS